MKITNNLRPTVKKLVLNHKGKTIGYYQEFKDGTFLLEKYVDFSKHYFVKHDGYGIQKSVFDKLIQDKEGTIRIVESDRNKIWLSSAVDWREHAVKENIGDYGEQLILSINKMVEEEFNIDI